MDLHVFKPKLQAQSILPALNSYIDSANTVSSNPPVSSTGHALDLRPVSPITQRGPPETVHGPPPPEEHSPMQEPDNDEEQEDPVQEPDNDEEQEDLQLVDEVLKIGDGDL